MFTFVVWVPLDNGLGTGGWARGSLHPRPAGSRLAGAPITGTAARSPGAPDLEVRGQARHLPWGPPLISYCYCESFAIKLRHQTAYPPRGRLHPCCADCAVFSVPAARHLAATELGGVAAHGAAADREQRSRGRGGLSGGDACGARGPGACG